MTFSIQRTPTPAKYPHAPPTTILKQPNTPTYLPTYRGPPARIPASPTALTHRRYTPPPLVFICVNWWLVYVCRLRAANSYFPLASTPKVRIMLGKASQGQGKRSCHPTPRPAPSVFVSSLPSCLRAQNRPKTSPAHTARRIILIPLLQNHKTLPSSVRPSASLRLCGRKTCDTAGGDTNMTILLENCTFPKPNMTILLKNRMSIPKNMTILLKKPHFLALFTIPTTPNPLDRPTLFAYPYRSTQNPNP
jgi:hypothetical protein